MPDINERRAILEEAASQGPKEHYVRMTYHEMLLFHMLLQDHGLPYVGRKNWIPLLLRNTERIAKIKEL